MNNNSTNTELLIRYLDKGLDEVSMLELERRLTKEPPLQQELERLQQARQAVNLYGLQLKVKTIHTEMMKEIGITHSVKKNPAIIRQFGSWGLRIAAAVLLVMLGTGVYEYSTLSADKLYSENYQPYSARISRGETNAEGIEKLWMQKDYAKVISEFESSSTHSIPDYFFAAQSYLQQNKVAPAINNFNQVLAANDSAHTNIFRDQSEYYLALAYLKSKEIDKARQLFHKIYSNKDHLYHDQVNRWFLTKVDILKGSK